MKKPWCVCVWGGIKSPCGNGRTHSRGLPHKVCVVSYGKTLGRIVGTGLEPRSRSRCLWGASSVCQPTGPSDDGAPFGCTTHQGGLSQPRKTYPYNVRQAHFLSDISIHLSDKLTCCRHFHKQNLRFLIHNGALGVKIGGKESYGRCASF